MTFDEGIFPFATVHTPKTLVFDIFNDSLLLHAISHLVLSPLLCHGLQTLIPNPTPLPSLHQIIPFLALPLAHTPPPLHHLSSPPFLSQALNTRVTKPMMP